MTPASFFAGAPPGGSGQKKEIEKPRPSPAGPRKSLYAVFSARETSLVHPLKVDSRMRESHAIVAVRLKPRITILLKRKRTARSRAAPTEGGHPLDTTRLNGCCLCAISQSGSYMSCRVGRSRAELIKRVSECVTRHRKHDSMRGRGGLRLRLTNPPSTPRATNRRGARNPHRKYAAAATRGL